MGKIKFTKTELKHQQDARKQFERFLPTLQLKKQQLQMEVRQSLDALTRNLEAQRKLGEELRGVLSFFGDETIAAQLESKVRVKSIRTGSTNVAGITIPTFESAEFEPVEVDWMRSSWFEDDALDALRRAVSLREAHKVLQLQYKLLASELRTTSQRVNLFEKVKIPECRENIRRINIMLGDANTSAVARCKIAKRKALAAAAPQSRGNV